MFSDGQVSPENAEAEKVVVSALGNAEAGVLCGILSVGKVSAIVRD